MAENEHNWYIMSAQNTIEGRQTQVPSSSSQWQHTARTTPPLLQALPPAGSRQAEVRQVGGVMSGMIAIVKAGMRLPHFLLPWQAGAAASSKTGRYSEWQQV